MFASVFTDIPFEITPTATKGTLLAFAATFIFAGLVMKAMGRDKATPWLGVSLGVGVIAQYLSHRGIPVWPVSGALPALPYTIVAGIALGLTIDHLNSQKAQQIATVAGGTLYSAAILYWMGDDFASGKSVAHMIYGRSDGWSMPLIFLALFGFLVSARMLVDRRDSKASILAIAYAGLGLFAVSAVYGSRVELHALALTGAAFALLALHPSNRALSHAASLTGMGVVVHLVATLHLSRDGLWNPAVIAAAILFLPGLFAGVKMSVRSRYLLQGGLSFGMVVLAGWTTWVRI